MFNAAGRIEPLLLLFNEFVVNVLSKEITNLPGAQNIDVNFRQYSGYLQAAPGHFLYYW